MQEWPYTVLAVHQSWTPPETCVAVGRALGAASGVLVGGSKVGGGFSVWVGSSVMRGVGVDRGVRGSNVNEVTHQRLTDIGRAPTFYDCLVDVRAV